MTESISRPPKIDRRSALKGAAVGAGITVLTGVAASLNGVGARQIDLETPPPATPGLIEPEPDVLRGPTVASKAAELGYDVEKIFRFVADEVRYEAYSGALRGANGTLWSLAGNSVDKSILLAALLDEALVDYRFAIGRLDDAGIERLTAAMTSDPGDVAATIIRATDTSLAPRPAGVLGEPVATPGPDLSDVDQEKVDALTATAAKAFELAGSRLDAQIDFIQSALSRAKIDIPAFTGARLPDQEAGRHIWVQVADGPVWVDYAPAVHGAVPGEISTAETPETRDDIPEDLFHMVTVRFVAEEFINGSNVRRDSISYQAASIDLVNVPISVNVMPPSSFKALGLTINQLFTGDATFVPTLVAGSLAITADVPIVFGSKGGGILDVPDETTQNDGPAEGETLALWLAVDVVSPGVDPVTVERPLLDRIGNQVRLEDQEQIDFSTIAPVTIVTDSDGQQVIPELARASILSVTSASLPATFAVEDTENLEVFGELMLASAGMTAFRDGLRIDAEMPRGFQTYISGPHVSLASMELADPTDAESAVTVSIDLLHHTSSAMRVGKSASTEAAVHPLLVNGVLYQIAEEMMLDPTVIGPMDARGITVEPGVGSLISMAVAAGVDIVAVTDPEQLAALDLEPVAAARLTRALREGSIAILPAESVEIAGAPRSGWWLIDPLSGATRDERDDGRGFAAFSIRQPGTTKLGPITEETTLLDIMIDVAIWYLKYKRRINCILGAAAVVLGLAGMLYNAAAAGSGTGNTGNILGVATSGAAAAGGAKSLIADCFLG